MPEAGGARPLPGSPALADTASTPLDGSEERLKPLPVPEQKPLSSHSYELGQTLVPT